MATAREIHRHMKSIGNIGKITKAMKMVAAARLRRAQEKAAASRPYALKIKEVLSNVAADTSVIAGLNPKEHPLLQHREVKRVGYLVLCSDKGLAGAYSANALKKAVAEISKCEHEVLIITSGRKAKEYFARRGYNVVSSHFGFSDRPTYEDAVDIAHDAMEAFASEQIDELHIVYTLFKNVLSQVPTSELILPVKPPEDVDSSNKIQESFIFEPSQDEALKILAPKYLQTIIYAALVQSAASELGSRMTAMSSATDNAGKLVQSLQLSYNKARQAGITRELNEIVGGVEALAQSNH